MKRPTCGGSFSAGLTALVLAFAARPPLCAAGSDKAGPESEAMDATTINHLNLIKDARIFFVHMSVGYNLIDGIKKLAKDAGVELKFAKPDVAKAIDGGVFIETEGGENHHPRSKVDALASSIREMKELRPEIALVKLCYVDFDPQTNVDALFSHYQETLAALKREHPEILFAHVTSPLVLQPPSSIKDSIRRLLGMEVWWDAANLKRQIFNDKMSSTFKDEPVFDLARVESTDQQGKRLSYKVGDKTIYALDPSYTSDNGHLNELGQTVAAKEMIRFLGETLKARRDKQPKTETARIEKAGAVGSASAPR